MPLTKKQRLILEAILFLIRKGELPTVREVGALVGLRSPATVFKHLQALQSEKLITISGKSRGIRINAPALAAFGVPLEDLPLAGQGDPRFHGSTSPPAKTFAGDAPAPHFSLRSARMLEFPGDLDATQNIPAWGTPPLETSRAGSAASGSTRSGIAIAGKIAAGRPIESFPDLSPPTLAIDPRLFAASGDLVALQVEGDSMIGAGILDGDYVIIRRQDSVEDGEIAAVIINGEGTLKRWRSHPPSSSLPQDEAATSTVETGRKVQLLAANERFDPIEITAQDRKEVIVFGKYVGLVRGELQIN
jgi:SOS-response transcriptional repressor LexA